MTQSVSKDEAAKKPRDGIEDLLAEIKDELKRQADRKTSLEQRAITVITTSSAFATIVFTLVAAITKGQGSANFLRNEHEPIQIAVGLFLGAAIVALFVNIPIPYREIEAKSISELAKWSVRNRDSKDTHLEVTEKLVDNSICDMREWQARNMAKAVVLEIAFLIEVVAVGFLLVALVRILANV